MPKILTIAALQLLDPSGRILLVRKQGTVMFMQPGGKLEPGESPMAAVLREVQEELGLAFAPGQVDSMGLWKGPAANETDTDIHAHLFGACTSDTPKVQAEIEQMLWIDPAAALTRGDIAPLLRDKVLPGLLGR
ncbi:NTP pyrophosphohydrolase [Arthrobacter sp. UCD-GKA]|uniref:NUDIX hydrolase n=1 Tax=Arthrobacter sp. UCD-GKA TaxID=1913576 RepID=UPI0008DCEA97|nr:NUDIX domain-containing protein [Arthrobacter sp. UCD-GKA]OIH82577.1 NTP pyrophosphohydrolase [Arthrobacter sp. UCD-GKA]